MRSLIAGLFFIVITIPSSGLMQAVYAQTELLTNVDGMYRPIKPARPLEDNGKVEVIDVFWYGCPHCYRFLPTLGDWERTLPDDVDYKHMPAIFRDSWEVHARAYYIARLLDVEERIHEPFFNAIHVDRRELNNKEQIRDFFIEQGVSGKDFDDTWDSFTVESLLRQSRVMVRRFGVSGTPSVVVAGKYLVSGSTAGSYKEMIRVVNVLVERERQTMMKTAVQ